MKVRALRRCFASDRLREEDEVFDYDGPPASYLVPAEAGEATPVDEKKALGGAESTPKPKKTRRS